MVGLPHLLQKFASSGSSCPHFTHLMFLLPLFFRSFLYKKLCSTNPSLCLLLLTTPQETFLIPLNETNLLWYYKYLTNLLFSYFSLIQLCRLYCRICLIFLFYCRFFFFSHTILILFSPNFNCFFLLLRMAIRITVNPPSTVVLFQFLFIKMLLFLSSYLSIFLDFTFFTSFTL